MSGTMPQGSVIVSPRFRGISAPLEDKQESLPQLLTNRVPKSASYAALEVKSSRASDDESDSIPHRLPRILKQRPETVPGDTLSRRPSNNSMLHLDEQQTRFVEVNKLPTPPYTISQMNRVNLMYVPTFRRAYLGPTTSTTLSGKPNRHTSFQPISKSANLQMPRRKCIVNQSSLTLTSLEHEIDARIKTEEQKIAWKLSPYQHSSFDMQALRGSTGPYSREFTIHCTAPSNWKRMKWGRNSFPQ